MNVHVNMIETLFIAVLVYLCGKYILSQVEILRRFFIPAPVIGGIIFSIITAIGHSMGWFQLEFDTDLRDLLMTMFFTTIGYSASAALLKQGGKAVIFFLLIAVGLLLLQNLIAVGLASLFHQSPIWGMSLGSIPMSGGHGTSAAFAPILENHGAQGALSIALAASTYGLIAGSLIGGPLGKLLVKQFKLESKKEESHTAMENVKNFFSRDIVKHLKSLFKITPNGEEGHLVEKNLLIGILFIAIAMGIGGLITPLLQKVGITLPLYLMPMIIAAIIRNIMDLLKKDVHMAEMSAIGNISLAIFLSMALMSLKLWDLYSLALPVIIILLAQTLLVFLYAYLITFRVMGRNYDAAVMAVGHCGFGLGATPNAMANMDAFTKANAPSEKAYIVLPLVASLFLDFCNTAVITIFISIFS